MCVEELYATRRVQLVRAAMLLLGDAGAAEEVVQEAFVQLYRSFDRLRDVQAAGGYLHRTVLNLAHSQLRRQAVAARHAVASVTAGAAATADSADAGALATADRQAVLAAIAALARRQRECIVLRWYLDLSEREIAETLGISGGAVKTHLHRGLSALAERLEMLR